MVCAADPREGADATNGALCTESRLREAVRESANGPAGPYWVRDGRDGEGHALYVRRSRNALQLRQADHGLHGSAHAHDTVMAELGSISGNLSAASGRVADAIIRAGYQIGF